MVKNKKQARALGRLGKGKKKTYADKTAARDQRRQAGIASGKARALARDLKLAAQLQKTINETRV